jgi:hypothetical protein
MQSTQGLAVEVEKVIWDIIRSLRQQLPPEDGDTRDEDDDPNEDDR